MIEAAILATDLSLHFGNLKQLQQLEAGGGAALDLADPASRSTLQAALMTAADLGATTKPWEYQQQVTHN